VSDEIRVHAEFVNTMVDLLSSCSLEVLELAGSDSTGLRSQGVDVETRLWVDLAILAVSTDIVAISIRDLNIPLDGCYLRGALQWIQDPSDHGDAPTPLNKRLLVFDHPGLDLGTELTDRFQELTHDNRTRFAFPDKFFKSAASSFGGQVIHAEEMGEEVAKHLIPEVGTRQDELRLALLNTTSYRVATTGRSEEFRNELFKLIDSRQTGAIHTLRQMMLEAHVGLTEQHLEQVWQRARERGVDLPDLPVQWLPPDRE